MTPGYCRTLLNKTAPDAALISGPTVLPPDPVAPGRPRGGLREGAIRLAKRPTWPAVRQAVMLGLSVTTQVIELIRALHGGL